ncbi:unnamed protein product [Symbiodinium microadriaticum]|nr:unnamed protein product [Symbiodinium microadriaticum]
MPDSRPNPRRLALLKELLKDILKPGYVNQRIESLKRARPKKQKGEPEEPFLYRFLDVTSRTVSEDQVTGEHNFSILAAYCSSFAGDLPTKKEAEVWCQDEAAVLRSFASYACERAQRNPAARHSISVCVSLGFGVELFCLKRNGEPHERMAALKQIIQARKQEPIMATFLANSNQQTFACTSCRRLDPTQRLSRRWIGWCWG